MGIDVKFKILLRRRIDEYFKCQNISRQADHRLLIKFLIFANALLLSYCGILFSTSTLTLLGSYGMFGLTAVLLAVNIGHESIHNALSKNKMINRMGVLTFFIAGISGPLWKRKHVTKHHQFTNVPGQDPDLQQSFLVRLDGDFPKTKYHSYQHIYIFVLYLLYTFHWTFVKDFREAIALSKRSDTKYSESVAVTILSKLIYLSIVLLLPYYLHQFDNFILIAFLFSYFVTAAFFGIFLIPIHINEYSSINRKDELINEPFTTQLKSTPNYSTHNPLLNIFLGGFNHHACHHLFPEISHVHYPALTEILRSTSVELNVPFVEVRLVDLIKSHYRYLKKLAQ